MVYVHINVVIVRTFILLPHFTTLLLPLRTSLFILSVAYFTLHLDDITTMHNDDHVCVALAIIMFTFVILPHSSTLLLLSFFSPYVLASCVVLHLDGILIMRADCVCWQIQ
jgi:hypothetical protein